MFSAGTQVWDWGDVDCESSFALLSSPSYSCSWNIIIINTPARYRSLADSQATLEIEFLHQSLNPYVTPTANDTLSKIYDTISQAYRRQKSSDDFHRELEGLKKLLGESRKATGLETVCFKVKKDRVGELREGK